MRGTLVCLLWASALTAAPVIRDISPHGAQRGRTIELTLKGDGLPASAQIRTTLPAGFARLVSKETMKPDSELPFLVELKADTPIGLYPIRVATNDGISNVVLFAVGDLPEIKEDEAENPKRLNDAFDKAEPVKAPVVINGTLTGGDQDNYSFTARAGERLVFEAEARRAGSAVDPEIEVFDAAGHEVAKDDDAAGIGDDARVEVKFARAGKYFVRVHDSRYSEQAPNFYRLRIASYSFAAGIFPLGWRRGEPVEISLVGGNLAAPVKVNANFTDTKAYAPVRLPGSPALPFYFALSDLPEMLEPADSAARPPELRADTVMNGRISRPGEIDRYRVKVNPGESWFFEVDAAALGTSQLDAILTLYDEKGRKLASRDDGNGIDPVLPAKIPDGVHEATLAVEDVLGRGGMAYGYRLQARRQPADFSAELLTPFVNIPAGGTAQVAVLVRRFGYEGPLRVKIRNLPAGFRVEGGHVPQEAADQDYRTENIGFKTARTVLTITAPDDARAGNLEAAVVAEAEMPAGALLRKAIGPGLITTVKGDRQKPVTAPWLDIALPVGIAKALPVKLTTPSLEARFSQGFEWPLQYKVVRDSSFKSPVRVSNAIAGGVGNLRILKGEGQKNPDAGAYTVSTNFATPATTFDMVLTAQTEIDGRPVTLTSPAVAIQVVPGYRVLLNQSTLRVDAGGQAEVSGNVWREPTFEGTVVKIQAGDLPDNVSCAGVEVPLDQDAFTIKCAAKADAKPGSYPIRIVSSAPNTGRTTKEEYKGADLDAKLVVTGAATAAR